MSSAKEYIQATSYQDLLWQYTMSKTHKSLPEGLKDSECKKRMLTIQPPIPYVPPINLHKKRDTEQIKVKLPNGTKFQMSAFGQGDNEEYLVNIITVKHLLEQKGTIQDVGKAFGAVLKVREQLEPHLEAPKEGKTKAEKYKQKQKLSAIKEDLKAARKLAGVEILKGYPIPPPHRPLPQQVGDLQLHLGCNYSYFSCNNYIGNPQGPQKMAILYYLPW